VWHSWSEFLSECREPDVHGYSNGVREGAKRYTLPDIIFAVISRS